MNGPRIAIVQDDATLRRVLADLLAGEGYAARCWPRGDGAEGDLRAAPPALVLLDIRLERPEAGWELLRRLRAEPATAGVPVLVTTADALFLGERAADVLALGAEILPLPFDLEELLARVRRLAGPPARG